MPSQYWLQYFAWLGGMQMQAAFLHFYLLATEESEPGDGRP
jgi:hypothetical protein